MAKNIIKELIIILLLCLAIILLLGILLYEYVPMSKTIPNPVSYTAPEEVQEELNDTSGDVLLTFDNNSESIDSTELRNYERINKYQPGKANPFSSYETSTSTSGENTTTANSSTGTNNSSNSSNSNNNSSNNTTTSGGSFFQDKGTK